MKRGAYSLRRRLAWLVFGVILAIGLLSSLVAYLRTYHEADELFDTQLAQIAGTLLALAESGKIERSAENVREHPRRHAVPIAYEIRLNERGESRLLVVSPGHAGFEPSVPTGYSDRRHRDKDWRLFSLSDDQNRYTVVVGERRAARGQLARETGLALLAPVLLALPLMILAVGWGTKRALRPLETLARDVGALDTRALEPLDATRPIPQEIAPLRTAFNALIERVADAFETERRFTADAAHELRTPLAALKVQTQVARRAQAGESQRHALDQVIAGVDRMTHLVGQLLTLARVEPAQLSATPAPYDPRAALQACCRAYAETISGRGQTLTVALAPGCLTTMDPAWLGIAMRNLVDNASNYAGENARIEVTLTPDGSGSRLRVADNGPGVPADLRSRLAARFQRGETEIEGCGLGLSIVTRIAELSHARLEFGEGLPRLDGGRGFAAILHFAPLD